MSIVPRAVIGLRRLARLPMADRLAQAWNANANAIEEADRQNVKTGQEIIAPALLLAAPDGSTWRVTVDNTGALQTNQVART